MISQPAGELERVNNAVFRKCMCKLEGEEAGRLAQNVMSSEEYL